MLAPFQGPYLKKKKKSVLKSQINQLAKDLTGEMALSSRVLLIRAPWDHNHLLSRKVGLYHAIYTQKPL